MSTRISGPAWAFSWVVVGLAWVASGAGVLWPGLYRDNPLVTAAWLGNDLVTLLVAVPVLVAAMLVARAGSRRAHLVWMGMLLYTLYNFQFYLFGAAFNALFLAYVGLFVFSTLALVFGLVALDVEALVRAVRPGPSDRGVAVWMALVGLLLGGFWTALAVRFWLTGAVPPMVEATAHPTNVTGALDLSLVVALAFLAAAFLWTRRPWGYVLAVIWNVKGAAYMLALSAATAAAWWAGEGGVEQVGLWAPIGVGCLVAAWVLLRRLAPDRPAERAS
jgi:hypothetical protein